MLFVGLVGWALYNLKEFEDQPKQGWNFNLIENDFQGLDGQEMPYMPDEFVATITDRYIELYEKITGNAFVKSETSNISARIQSNVDAYLNSL
jgi:hypothetical protein